MHSRCVSLTMCVKPRDSHPVVEQRQQQTGGGRATKLQLVQFGDKLSRTQQQKTHKHCTHRTKASLYYTASFTAKTMGACTHFARRVSSSLRGPLPCRACAPARLRCAALSTSRGGEGADGCCPLVHRATLPLCPSISLTDGGPRIPGLELISNTPPLKGAAERWSCQASKRATHELTGCFLLLSHCPAMMLSKHTQKTRRCVTSAQVQPEKIGPPLFDLAAQVHRVGIRGELWAGLAEGYKRTKGG